MWAAADAYERFMGRWSRPVAQTLLDELGAPPAASWVDVGCGVGSLGDLVVGRYQPSRVVGVDASPAFLTLARARVPAMEVVQADAGGLPFPDATFDAAVSGLVVNFVADPGEAVRELCRVVRPGGTVTLYVWDYDHPDFFLTRFWAALEAVTGRHDPDDERGRWRCCSEDGLAELVGRTPLGDLSVRAVETVTRFADAADLWEGFELGVGPAGHRLQRLPADLRRELRTSLGGHWPVADDGSVTLTARAIAATGRVPG